MTQQIAAVTREKTRGINGWADVPSNVGLSLGSQRRGDRNADLDNSAAYLQFFTTTLGVSVFPRATQRPRAEASGTKSKPDSSKWEAHQFRYYLQSPACSGLRTPNLPQFVS